MFNSVNKSREKDIQNSSQKCIYKGIFANLNIGIFIKSPQKDFDEHPGLRTSGLLIIKCKLLLYTAWSKLFLSQPIRFSSFISCLSPPYSFYLSVTIYQHPTKHYYIFSSYFLPLLLTLKWFITMNHPLIVPSILNIREVQPSLPI